MGQAYNLKKISWFINPWIDIVILTGFPAVLIVIYLVNHLRLHFPTVYLFFYSYLFTGFILPHLFVTLGIVYLDKQVWKKNIAQLLWVPMALIIFIIFLSARGYFSLFTTVLFYLIILHILIENYYILQLHKLRNHDCHWFDNIVDNITIMLIPVYFVLKSLPYLKIDYYGSAIYNFPVNLHILNFLFILMCFSTVIFTVRQITLFIKLKKVHIFKVSMVLTTILSFYYSLLLLKNADIFLMCVFRWQHNIQYIVWTWFYNRNKFKNGVHKEAMVISYLSQPGRAGLYILFFILISAIFILVIRNLSFFRFHADLKQVPHLVRTIIIFLHVYLDGRIWKISKIHGIVNA